MSSIIFLLGYVLFINLLGLIVMGIDKRKAKMHAFRIPEATLFAVAILGGSIGSILGMYIFRHKTKHKKFTIGMPIILVLQVLLFFYVTSSGIEFRFM